VAGIVFAQVPAVIVVVVVIVVAVAAVAPALLLVASVVIDRVEVEQATMDPVIKARLY
jgi:hypothetical protein